MMTFSRNSDWKDADTLWTKVLAQQPDNPRANFHLGAKYEEQKEYVKAAVFYEKAVKFYPAHNWNPDSKTTAAVKESLSHIYYVLSLRLYKANKFPEAMDYGRKALANDDKNAPAYVVLGDIYAQQGDLTKTKAAEAYQSALRADPEQYEAKENLRRIEAAGQDVRQSH